MRIDEERNTIHVDPEDLRNGLIGTSDLLIAHAEGRIVGPYDADADEVFAEMADLVRSGKRRANDFRRVMGLDVGGRVIPLEPPPHRYVRWIITKLTGWAWPMVWVDGYGAITDDD